MRQSEKLFQDGWSFPRNDSFARGNQIEFTSVSAQRHLESSGRQEARLKVALEFEDSFHQAGLLSAHRRTRKKREKRKKDLAPPPPANKLQLLAYNGKN